MRYSLIALVACLACHDNPAGPPPAFSIARASTNSGDLQIDTVLAPLAPLRVLIRSGDAPANDVKVYWTIARDTLIASSTTTTGPTGIASLVSAFGPTAGTYRVEAALAPTATAPRVTFTLTATPGHPNAIRIVSGLNQRDTVTAQLGAEYVVQVTDDHDNGVAGVVVDWAVTSGAGSITPGRNTTSAPNGYATARHRLGSTDSVQTVTATATRLPNAPAAIFAATAVVPTLGNLEVKARTAGVELDVDGYSIIASFSRFAPRSADVGANAATMISGVVPGTYSVTLGGLAANCDANPSSQSIAIAGGATVTASFDVNCAPAMELLVGLTRDGNSDVYRLKANGNGLTRLTTQGAYDGAAVWSPDGSRIAFDSQRDGETQIYVMNADGSGQVRLTTTTLGGFLPSWSPDGRRIAFLGGEDAEGNTDIYVTNADGSGQIRLTSNPLADFQPVWSPDGRKIAFVSQRDGGFGIYVVNADGSNTLRLTSESVSPRDPAWSPDGSRIAFTRNYSNGEWDLYVMNADGSAAASLVANGTQPVWSPDGKRIVFTRNYNCDYYTGCNSSLFVANADGSGIAQLTTGAFDSGAAWSPDGRWIAFGSYVCTPQCGDVVRLVRSDGTRLIDLATGAMGATWKR